MIQQSKLLTIMAISLFLGSFLFLTKAKALPLTANIYGSIGAAYSRDHFSGSVTDDIKNDFSVKGREAQNINFALGISPNIPIPLISDLRFEVSYSKSLKNSSNNLTGASLYYDLKLLPVVTPYVGVSLLYYDPKVALHGSESVKEKVNQGLTGFNAGVSVGLPAFPLTVYGEYRYAIPGIFKNNLSFSKNDVTYDASDYHLSMFMIGVRYYFL